MDCGLGAAEVGGVKWRTALMHGTTQPKHVVATHVRARRGKVQTWALHG